MSLLTPEEMSLKVENLTVRYKTSKGLLSAVDSVDLELVKGKIYALVGESGCGKSTLGLSIPRLLPEDQVEYSGRIMYKGTDILSLDEDGLERVRGSEFASIFQEPLTSLNPVYRVGEQIAEALAVRASRHGYYTGGPVHKPSAAQRLFGLRTDSLKGYSSNLRKFFPRVYDLLVEVWIPSPKRVAEMYPHELSGGMRQRIMIAIALAGSPEFLIADEPTTALDVTTQIQILKLIKKINKEFEMGVLLITHDLGVVAAVADYALVMYAGRIVEEAPKDELMQNPLHPYTQGLIASFPKGRKKDYTLSSIPGTVPPLGMYPAGCRFNPRCPRAFAPCPSKIPPMVEVSKGHKVACLLYGGA